MTTQTLTTKKMKTLPKQDRKNQNEFFNIKESSLGRLSDSHGFAPSATISIRIEDKLMSLWSLVAIMAQWRSRHFTKATRAMRGEEELVIYDTVTYRMCLLHL